MQWIQDKKNNLADMKLDKKLLLILFTSFFFFQGKAQEIVISNPVKISSKLSDFEILGKNQNGLYVRYYNGTTNELELFNQQLRSVSKREVDVKDKNSKIESIFLQDDRAVVFYTSQINGNLFLKARWLNNYLEPSNTEFFLDSIVNIKNAGYYSYYIKQSTNLKYFSFFSIFEDKAGFSVKYQVLNSDLEFVADGVFEIKQKDMILKSFKINDNGVVYAVMAHQIKGSDANDYVYDQLYSFIYNPTTQLGLEQHNEISEGLRFKNIITEIDNFSNRAYTASNYLNKDNPEDLGLFILSTEPNSAHTLQHRYPYTKEAMSRLHSYDAKDWKDQAMIIRPKQIITQSDGGCVVISEGQYQYTKVIRSTPYSYPYSMYGDMYTKVYDQNHYFDISAASIDGNGKINWTALMPKMQMTEGDGGMYSSYVLMEANNVLKFLFNEDIYSNGNFVEYNLNPAGETKNMSLLNSQKDELVLIPQKGLQISPTEVVIPSEQKRILQLVLFKY
jgi:hypothetical protein